VITNEERDFFSNISAIMRNYEENVQIYDCQIVFCYTPFIHYVIDLDYNMRKTRVNSVIIEKYDMRKNSYIPLQIVEYSFWHKRHRKIITKIQKYYEKHRTK